MNIRSGIILHCDIFDTTVPKSLFRPVQGDCVVETLWITLNAETLYRKSTSRVIF